MKKVFLLCSVLLILLGCEKKNVESESLNNNQIEFTCQINENDILNCDNEFSTYNENGNLISIVSKNGTNESYNYLYNEKGLITFIEKKDGQQILINYNENDKPYNIQYVLDPYIDDSQKTIITYTILYDNNKIKQIEKSYNHSNIKDTIEYEYYEKNNINYGKETKIIGGKKIIRTFKLENMKYSNNIFELINFFPSVYYENLKYYPYYNFGQVNYGIITDTPTFLPAIESIETTNFNGEITNSTNYYYDSKNRFIKDSENNIIHMFVQENQNKLIRYTILKKELGTQEYPYTSYIQYKTEYMYQNNKIVKFVKYKETQISKAEYNDLKNKYIENMN